MAMYVSPSGKSNGLLADINDFSAVNDVYKQCRVFGFITIFSFKETCIYWTSLMAQR